MFSIQELGVTVVFYYAVIDSRRSIKLHSHTDLFWNTSSNVVCNVYPYFVHAIKEHVLQKQS